VSVADTRLRYVLKRWGPMKPMSRQGSCLNPRFTTASRLLGLERMGIAWM
jgi:hypothetical protein